MSEQEHTTCHADAPSGESGLLNNSPLHENEREPSLTQLLFALVHELRVMNQSLGEICAANAQLVDLLASDEEEDEAGTYLDGNPQ